MIRIVGSIITEFLLWREEILLKMLKKEDMPSIIDYMGKKVSNPFALLDDNGFILARSKGYNCIPGGTIWDTLKGNYLNLYDFYSPKEWKNIREQITAAGRRHILFCPERDVQHTYYTISLFDNGNMLGSIGAIDINGSFTDAEIAVMDMIRDMLEVYFSTEYDAVGSGKIITTSFNRLINGDYDIGAVRKSLNKRHWKTDDVFYLLAFEYLDTYRSEIELTSQLNLIHMQFPKSMTGLRNKQIIVVVRKEDYNLRDKR